MGGNQQEVRRDIRWALIEKKLFAPDTEEINFYWSDRYSRIQIYGPFGSAGAQALNEDQKVKGKVAAALKSVYRYSGEFVFDDDDIPF